MSLVLFSGATVPALGMTNSSVTAAVADDDDDDKDRKDEKKRKKKLKEERERELEHRQWFDDGHYRYGYFPHRRWYLPCYRRGFLFRYRF
jgi:hypothetical protein